jgi:S-layer homology domain
MRWDYKNSTKKYKQITKNTMNEEENNNVGDIPDDNLKIVEAPKKKSRWLLGTGIVAVAAVVVGTLVFAQNGEWFKGNMFEKTLPGTLPTNDIKLIELDTTPDLEISLPGDLTEDDLKLDLVELDTDQFETLPLIVDPVDKVARKVPTELDAGDIQLIEVDTSPDVRISLPGNLTEDDLKLAEIDTTPEMRKTLPDGLTADDFIIEEKDSLPTFPGFDEDEDEKIKVAFDDLEEESSLPGSRTPASPSLGDPLESPIEEEIVIEEEPLEALPEEEEIVEEDVVIEEESNVVTSSSSTSTTSSIAGGRRSSYTASTSSTTNNGTCDCNWIDATTDSDGYAAKQLCEMGCIVSGHEDGTVRLNETISRAELLAIAFRASEYENIYDVDVNSDYCFNDVTNAAEGDWFASYMCTAKDKGFVQGYDGDLAKPANTITLAEALKMILGALDKNYEINASGDWYIDMVKAANQNGYLPYEINTLNDIEIAGKVELTRGKAFNMLYRILKD